MTTDSLFPLASSFMYQSQDLKTTAEIVSLLTEENKYRVLIEHIPAITYIAAMDELSSTLYASPQIERLLGFSQTEWMEDHTLWLKQIHPADRGFVLAELKRIHGGGDPIQCEYRMFTRTGEVVWFRDDAAILRGADGTPLLLYGVMLDITERKRLESELAATQYQLSESRKPHLSPREQAVLGLIREGKTDFEIGQQLALAERTVRYSLQRIYGKLGVTKRREAVEEAIHLRLLEDC